MVPALLTRMCKPPYADSVAATISRQDSSLAASCTRKSARPPARLSRFASASPRAASMSVSMTAAPSRTNSSASAVPCPPAAPVISATLLASFGIEFSLEKKDNASPQRTQRTRKGREGTEYGSGTVVGWVERSETHHQKGYQSDSGFAAFNHPGAMALQTEN